MNKGRVTWAQSLLTPHWGKTAVWRDAGGELRAEGWESKVFAAPIPNAKKKGCCSTCLDFAFFACGMHAYLLRLENVERRSFT